MHYSSRIMTDTRHVGFFVCAALAFASRSASIRPVKRPASWSAEDAPRALSAAQFRGHFIFHAKLRLIYRRAQTRRGGPRFIAAGVSIKAAPFIETFERRPRHSGDHFPGFFRSDCAVRLYLATVLP